MEKFKNWGMIIPHGAAKVEDIKEDERGAPIYAGCPAKGGLCACLGTCRKIIGWSKDPEDVAKYRASIKSQQEAMVKFMNRHNPKNAMNNAPIVVYQCNGESILRKGMFLIYYTFFRQGEFDADPTPEIVAKWTIKLK